MKRETIVRAWKDPEFRAGLTSEERSALPESPAGEAFTELDEHDLADAVGGAYYLDFDGCTCSDWTMPLTTRTYTTTRINLNDSLVRYDLATLDQSAFLTKSF